MYHAAATSWTQSICCYAHLQSLQTGMHAAQHLERLYVKHMPSMQHTATSVMEPCHGTLSWKQSVRPSSVQLTMVSNLCLCSMADMFMYICMQGNLSLALMLQGCVGKQLAMVEMKVLMACWFQSFVICTRSGPCQHIATTAYPQVLTVKASACLSE